MMKRPSYIPHDYNRVAVVGSLGDMFTMPLRDPLNCVVRPRKLSGDFDGVARKLEQGWLPRRFNQDSRLRLQENLQKLVLSEEETKAARIITRDLKNIFNAGYTPTLRLIPGSGYDAMDDEVLDYHMDGVWHGISESILTVYNREPTLILRNDQAVTHDGENYLPLNGAKPFSFAIGDMWRQCNRKHPQGVPGLIHAAPPRLTDEEMKSDPAPRLIVVAWPRYR